MTATRTRFTPRRCAALVAPTLLLLPVLLFAGKGGLPGITPSPFAYGSVPIGSSSPAQTFTLDNPSAETLTITSAGLAGAAPTQFTVNTNGCAGAVLMPGMDCTLTVRFTPGAAGNQVALVRVLYTSAGSPGGVEVTSAISGTGLPPQAAAVPAPAVGTLALALGALLMVLGAWVGRRAG